MLFFIFYALIIAGSYADQGLLRGSGTSPGELREAASGPGAAGGARSSDGRGRTALSRGELRSSHTTDPRWRHMAGDWQESSHLSARKGQQWLLGPVLVQWHSLLRVLSSSLLTMGTWRGLCSRQGSGPHRSSKQHLEHFQSHFPHCFKPQISTSVYLNWLVIAELICLKAEPETLGSWTGKSQTNKQNLLKL